MKQNFFENYSDEDLKIICKEIFELQKTGILCNGKLREAKNKFCETKNIEEDFDLDYKFMSSQFLIVIAKKWCE